MAEFLDIRFKGDLGKQPEPVAVAINEKNWDEKIKNFHSEFEKICQQEIAKIDPKEFPFAEMVAEALFGLNAYSLDDSGSDDEFDSVINLIEDQVFAKPEIMYVPEEILEFCPEQDKLKSESDLYHNKQKRSERLRTLASKKKALAMNPVDKQSSVSTDTPLLGQATLDKLTKDADSDVRAHADPQSEPSWPLALSKLHLTPEGQLAQIEPPRSGHDPFRKRWAKSLQNKKFRQKVFTLFQRFVTKIAKQHFGELVKAQRVNSEKTSPETSVYFQINPSVRIHMPETGAMGVPHCDADYYHQRGEVNFWWPVVHETFNSNSLYCESVRNRNDFTPFNLKYGEYMKFYGNQTRHFTVPNVTDITRVSLDIRVIPGPLFIEKWSSTASSTYSASRAIPFTAGGYYQKLDVKFTL